MRRLHPIESAAGQDPRSPAIANALSELAQQGDGAHRGAVYTQAWVVQAILDLVGYTQNLDLRVRRILEPAFGGGDFLFPLLERLLASYLAHGGSPERALAELGACVRAVEIHIKTYRATRQKVEQRLVEWGMSRAEAEKLAGQWLIQDDFLLAKLDESYDVVVGNPPYVRQERIPEALLRAYKTRYQTIYDRADLYIPFYERCLDLLSAQGVLGFICANRWIKNKYGGPLRAKVCGGFDLTHYVNLEQIEAFQATVNAYPSLTIIRRRGESQAPRATKVVQGAIPDERSFSSLVQVMQKGPGVEHPKLREVRVVGQGRDPWLLEHPAQIDLIRRLEQSFPTLQAAGCTVGIGVATGADAVFIAPLKSLPVEPERKLPLVMASDLVQGELRWGEKGVVNPFEEDGSLASLDAYPRFAAYLEQHRSKIESRHVAKKNPKRWYRTIDRIYPSLVRRPKLLIPDIKGTASVVYDAGNYYPHHNLYVVMSETWDLRALQTLLRSSLALLFVAAYSVRMARGFLRFQAQYLRRIRIPLWESIPESLRSELCAVSQSRVLDEIDAPVFRLFELSRSEQDLVKSMAQDARA